MKFLRGVCPHCNGELQIPENLDTIICMYCGKEFSVFGESKVDEVATNFDLKLLGRIPFDVDIAKACDRGDIESVDARWHESAVEAVKRLK